MQTSCGDFWTRVLKIIMLKLFHSSVKSASAVVSNIKIQTHISLELFSLVNAADFSPDSDTFSLDEELL